MNPISRRHFMSMLGAGGASLSIAPLLALQAGSAFGASPKGEPAFGAGFGPIAPKLPLNAGSSVLSNPLIGDLRNQSLLALPDGFDYWVISPTGDTLSDGNTVPSNHDGMAAFRGPNGGTVLIRNHEITSAGAGGTRVITPSSSKYNPDRGGGTTTLVLDNQGQLVSHIGSLAGTIRNCAGGPTPWDSWLSCEETFNTASGATIRHGYVFEVPVGGESNHQPIRAMGRRNHEAAAVDPSTGYVYLTEDRGDSLFYRFRPNVYGNLQAGGVLEALKIVDMPGVNTAMNFRQYLFQPLAAEWVTIDLPDPDTESNGMSNRAQGQAKGAARFTRGEGCWWGNGKVYFVCSNGGDAGAGQVFAYDPLTNAVTLFVESVKSPNGLDADNGGFVLAAPDNVAVGPDGRVYLCEDGSGVEKVVGVGLDGELYEVARNVIGGPLGNGSEFAGACFSHDGRFLFVSAQNPGLTYVIRGPWRMGRRF